MLIRSIIAYLATHKRLVIPQLGAFLVKEPGREVVFSELIRRDDGVLRALLEAEGLTSIAATGEIDRLVFEVRHGIKERGEYLLEGLGRFRAGANATMMFVYEPAPIVAAEPTVVAEEPVRSVVEQPVEVSEAAEEESTFEERDVEIVIGNEPLHAEVSVVASAEASAEPSVEAEEEELHLSVSAKMNPAACVKGLKYGKPPKNTNAFTYVDKPRRSGGDRFIWFAVVAILLALGAIAFGFYHEWSEGGFPLEKPVVEVQPTDSLTTDMLQ